MMVAMWMAYGAVVALLLAGAAAALERVLRLRGRPARWVWAVTLGGSWILPLATWFRPPRLPAAPGAAGNGAGSGLDPALLAALLESAEAPSAVAPAWLHSMGVALGIGWGVLALVSVGLFALAVQSVARRSQAWPTRRVRGEPVRISPDFGPAVVGLRRPEIVLPEWAFELGRTAQELVIRHEAEHRDARDTLLLAAGTVATLAAPWNPALWWQLRRLRLAVELDCDARVLDGGVSPRRYGDLLLSVGERMGRSAVPVAALAEPRSFLERRLRTMTERTAKGSAWKMGAGLVVATLMVAAACRAPAPPAADIEVSVEIAEDATASVEAIAEKAEAYEAVAAEYRAVEEELVRRQAEAERAARAREVLGRDGTITLRGTTSLDASDRTPLIYVDGVRIEGGVERGSEAERTLPNGVRPDDIDRIEVLKGDAARSLYGDAAAGGIVQIFTKKREVATARFEIQEKATVEAAEEPGGVLRGVKVTESGDDGSTVRFRVRQVPVDEEPGVTRRVMDVARQGLARALGLIVKPLRSSAEPSGSPLVLVDGEEWSGKRLETLDRDRIDRVEVIRGEAARKEWGERAAHGVIKIFLKE